MKQVSFVGSARADPMAFPPAARRQAGFELGDPRLEAPFALRHVEHVFDTTHIAAGGQAPIG